MCLTLFTIIRQELSIIIHLLQVCKICENITQICTELIVKTSQSWFLPSHTYSLSGLSENWAQGKVGKHKCLLYE